MVVRALLAVLTLLGAVPFRVCTCGAAHVHQKAPAPQPDHASHTGCGGHQAADDPPVHDHDCPAVKPRAAMPLAVAATVAELPTDCPIVIVGDESPASQTLTPLVSAEPRSPDPPPGQPLYLTLRTLRN